MSPPPRLLPNVNPTRLGVLRCGRSRVALRAGLAFVQVPVSHLRVTVELGERLTLTALEASFHAVRIYTDLTRTSKRDLHDLPCLTLDRNALVCVRKVASNFRQTASESPHTAR